MVHRRWRCWDSEYIDEGGTTVMAQTKREAIRLAAKWLSIPQVYVGIQEIKSHGNHVQGKVRSLPKEK